MATSFPISARTLQNGSSSFGPVAVPVGTHQASLNIDVSLMTTGQVVNMLIEYSADGITWLGCKADFNGPWFDPHGVLHNDITIRCDFGMFVDGSGAWQPRVSAAGWQARGTIIVTNGPISIGGGTLTLT